MQTVNQCRLMLHPRLHYAKGFIYLMFVATTESFHVHCAVIGAIQFSCIKLLIFATSLCMQPDFPILLNFQINFIFFTFTIKVSDTICMPFNTLCKSIIFQFPSSFQKFWEKFFNAKISPENMQNLKAQYFFFILTSQCYSIFLHTFWSHLHEAWQSY